MPEWLKGEITREEAEEFVRPLVDGKFVVRKRAEGGHVLCVVYRGKPTHHLIAPDDSGTLKVNRKAYGSSTSDLEELIAHLRNPPPGSGWPIGLKAADEASSTGGAGPAGEPPVARKASTTAAGGKMPKWLHPPMEKEEANRLLETGGLKDGRFIVRKRGKEFPNDYVLSIVFRGRPTHHLISPNSEGIMTVNKKSYGADIKNVKQLVLAFAYEDLPEGWPVRLKEYVTREESVAPLRLRHTSSQRSTASNDSQGSGGSGSSAGMSALPMARADSVTDSTGSEGKPPMARADSVTGSTGSEGKPPMARADSTISRSSGGQAADELGGADRAMAWMHKEMSNDDAKAIIDGHVEGHFMVRKYKAPDQYVLSVVYKGKPTHHLIVAPEDDGSTINKKQTGVSGIVNTIQLLRSKQPFWPVPLATHAESEPEAVPEEPVAEEPAAPGAEPEPAALEPDKGGADAEAPEKEAPEKSDQGQQSNDDEAARQREEDEKRKLAADEEADKKRKEAEAEAKRKAEEEESKRKAEEEAEAKHKAEEDAEAKRKAVEEEARRKREEEEAKEEITGFFELDDPFPAGEEEDYEAGHGSTAAPSATTLVQAAREMARQSQLGAPPGASIRYSVGKVLRLEPIGQSSTDSPDVEQSAANPYSVRAEGERVRALEEQVKALTAQESAQAARVASLEKHFDMVAEVLTFKTEVRELRKKNAELEKKLVLLENILLATNDSANIDAHVTIEVRLIKREGFGTRESIPKLTDVGRALLIGRARVLKRSTYADVRSAIVEDFDTNQVPAKFKFFFVSEGSNNMVVIHDKQESKTPVEDAVVYIHDSAPRKSEDVVRASVGAWASKATGKDRSWVKNN